MNGWLTVGLLVVSNIFMTFAWYGHLKLQQMKVITSATPLITVILLSWGIAFSLLQLKVIQEVISLMIFTVFTILFFRGEALHWNHFLAFCLLIIAVYLVFMDN